MRNGIKSLAIWILILPLAILNGGFRDKIMSPAIGESVAMPLSGILLCLLILALTSFLLPKLVRTTAKEYILIGILWIVLTVGMEFAIGVVMGKSLEQMLAAYNLSGGNLWLIVILFSGIAPWLGARLKQI